MPTELYLSPPFYVRIPSATHNKGHSQTPPPLLPRNRAASSELCMVFCEAVLCCVFWSHRSCQNLTFILNRVSLWLSLCIFVDVRLCGEFGMLCKRPWPLSKWLSHHWRTDISLHETVSELKMQISFGIKKNKIWTGCGISCSFDTWGWGCVYESRPLWTTWDPVSTKLPGLPKHIS